MSNYLKYRIMNIEPLRIADDSTSQNGQTSTLRYIPGSTIRGLIIHQFVNVKNFDELKRILLSNGMAFLNAYPATNNNSLIPSPKGFYEDKTTVEANQKKELQNVVISGEFSDGLKRAGLGSYCYIDDEDIHYYNIKIGSDMKIRINNEDNEKQTVFRSEYIRPGHCFEGYIKLSDVEEIDEVIKSLFSKDSVIILGNAGTFGMGKCKVISADAVDGSSLAFDLFDAKNEAYMMLLSNTCMRNDVGEYCGLNLTELEKMLGVSNLKISYCSTSTHDIKGYNRTWGTKIPSVLAYEAGSVFHLSYNGIIDKEHMQALCDRGVGVRRNEGMGRIVFLKDYENVRYKISEEYLYDEMDVENVEKAELSTEEVESLKIIAKNHLYNVLDTSLQKYITENKLKSGLKNSQTGTIESIIMMFRYDPMNARQSLEKYFGHAVSKDMNQKIHKERVTRNDIQKQVESILEKPLKETLSYSFKEAGKVLGIPINEIFSKEEEEKYKLKVLVEMIRYDHKKEVK